MTPLTRAELAATLLRHKARLDTLRAHGMHPPYWTRSDVADWTLDRWELKQGRKP